LIIPLRAEGIGYVVSKDLLIADHPEGITRRVVELRSDGERTECLGRRSLITDTYYWRAVEEFLLAPYHEWSDPHRRGED
jgi:hypothetical protein